MEVKCGQLYIHTSSMTRAVGATGSTSSSNSGLSLTLALSSVVAVTVVEAVSIRVEASMTETALLLACELDEISLAVIIAAFSMFNSMSTAAWAALGDFTKIANTLWYTEKSTRRPWEMEVTQR